VTDYIMQTNQLHVTIPYSYEYPWRKFIIIYPADW